MSKLLRFRSADKDDQRLSDQTEIQQTDRAWSFLVVMYGLLPLMFWGLLAWLLVFLNEYTGG